MAERVCVTGGGGFLGREIVARLLARGTQVVVLQRSAAGLPGDGAVRHVAGALTDPVALDAAVQGCAAVIHVAAKAGVWGSRAEYEATNIDGTQAVLDACRRHGVGRLVYTSTPSVVFNGGPFRGADASLPYGRAWLCHYARTKAEAERRVLAAHGAHGLQVCALRPHLIWGVGDPHILPRVIARARLGQLRIVGDGLNRVDITHVANAAQAHLQALDALAAGRCGGKAYFLSQGEPVALWPWINGVLQRLRIAPVTRRVPLPLAYTVGGLAECVWRVFRLRGEPPMTRFVAVELSKDHWFDIRAAREDFGYAPEQHPTEAGVAAYVASVQAGLNTSQPRAPGPA